MVDTGQAVSGRTRLAAAKAMQVCNHWMNAECIIYDVQKILIDVSYIIADFANQGGFLPRNAAIIVGSAAAESCRGFCG
ncbi:hypothetical protein [Tahibacter caeni]|uniref:hypothetical protein n=1 Tax=Tahibacter caeni TaxID=1453545 RepID=UPI002147C740|nr:hypothetical protein [Tahibacter caeni]